MKLIIAGSRKVLDKSVVEEGIRLALAQWNLPVEEVVSGKQVTYKYGRPVGGVDWFGEQWAQEHGIPVKPFPADWARFRKPAGMIRNRQMAAYGTHLVAVWNGVSPGTANMIDEMQKLGKPVYVHRV